MGRKLKSHDVHWKQVYCIYNGDVSSQEGTPQQKIALAMLPSLDGTSQLESSSFVINDFKRLDKKRTSTQDDD